MTGMSNTTSSLVDFDSDELLCCYNNLLLTIGRPHNIRLCRMKFSKSLSLRLPRLLPLLTSLHIFSRGVPEIQCFIFLLLVRLVESRMLLDLDFNIVLSRFQCCSVSKCNTNVEVLSKHQVNRYLQTFLFLSTSDFFDRNSEKREHCKAAMSLQH